MQTDLGLPFIDIAIVVPLEEEITQVMKAFPSIENRSTRTSFRHLVDTGAPEIACLVVQQTEMGKTACERAAAEVLAEYRVGVLVCLGIAGALSEDVGLCDVCYTGRLIDVYDNAKVEDAATEGLRISFSSTHFETPLELTTSLNFIRTQPELQDLYRTWQRERADVARALITKAVPGRGGKLVVIAEPKTISGIIVCGAVSKSEKYNKTLAEVDRKILAIETESGGLFGVAKSAGIPAIAIRGICDNADVNKSRIETETAGTVRAVAAGNAVSFLKLQLSNPYFREALKRSPRLPNLEFTSPGGPKQDPATGLTELLRMVADDTDRHLRELCPEYRLHTTGYKLPIPRVRRRENSKNLDPKNRPTALEMRAVIETQKIAMVEVARNYPDQSLPWMIAHDLLTGEIDNRQPIPLVVAGDRLSPPRSGLSRVSSYDIDALNKMPGVVPVIIIDDCPLSSPTKMKFLFEEIANFPNARYVFVSRGNGVLIYSIDSAVQFQVELFEVCDISFSELASFVEQNFKLTNPEAEVIAYRLQETFSRFGLSAHPSYLATISNSSLAALIDANKRSELIQIAVDATLSFAVANDPSDISLSRTTRSRFLQRLVRAIRIDGRSFDQAGLISFTEAFAQEYDFDIDPMRFILTFADRGIIYFDSGMARISLHYVESYLLAKELSTAPSCAVKYFRLPSPNLDLPTLDIYAELGPAEDVVKMIRSELIRILKTLPSGGKEQEHAILRLPNSGVAAAKITAVATQMEEAIDEVVAGRRSSERKQQILDIRAQVREKAAVMAQGNNDLEAQQHNMDEQILMSGALAWFAGMILISSGAEHLRAGIKRDLAPRLVEVSSRLLDFWMTLCRKVDFGTIRDLLTNDDNFSRFCASNDEHVRATVRTLLGNIVDLIEQTYLTNPLLTVLWVTAMAGQPVLARSLSQLECPELSQQLVHSMWLLEADPAGGEARASETVRKLPRIPLLRNAIFNYLLASAYWNHSDREGRRHILEVARVCIQPFRAKIDPKVEGLVTQSVKHA